MKAEGIIWLLVVDVEVEAKSIVFTATDRGATEVIRKSRAHIAGGPADKHAQTAADLDESD